ncbi:MAG TPA: MBL fold metallo-hydrolase [Myxococcota bacterium]|nr:MBL fold metallo-hydrolase [Myxococcota bacterium]
MAFEIDFLAVGDGDRGGDAIALRFGNLSGPREQQTVIVIDGGWTDTGSELVDLIRKCYGTDRVDVVISTHPDADHSSGLLVLLDELKVGDLLMHLSWDHTGDIARMFRDDRVTDESVRLKLRRSLESACALSTKAKRKGIPITEPFQGVSGFNGQLEILGPTRSYYDSLLPHFRGTPDPMPLATLLAGLRSPQQSPPLGGLLGQPSRLASSLLGIRATESHEIETLIEPSEGTSPENNTSAITLIRVDGKALLFTGDAGIPALTIAADRLNALGLGRAIDFIQVPHHGSRRNVGPAILDRLVGPRLSQAAMTKMAFCSCPKDSQKHPAKKVANAFRRRGAPVHATKGMSLRWNSKDAPPRPNYGPATPLPHYFDVEDAG